MISGATEEELELANARADILLMCGSETLKIIDKYYKKQLEAYENMRKEAVKYLRSNEWYKDYEKSSCRTHLLNILNKVGDSNE